MSGPGTRPGPGSEPRGPRTSRWRDIQWWLGRTDEQRARRDQAWEEFREARAEVRRTWRDVGRAGAAGEAPADGSLGSRIGSIGKVLTISVTMPIIALAIFGPVGLVVAVVLAVLLLAGRLGAARR